MAGKNKRATIFLSCYFLRELLIKFLFKVKIWGETRKRGGRLLSGFPRIHLRGWARHPGTQTPSLVSDLLTMNPGPKESELCFKKKKKKIELASRWVRREGWDGVSSPLAGKTSLLSTFLLLFWIKCLARVWEMRLEERSCAQVDSQLYSHKAR